MQDLGTCLEWRCKFASVGCTVASGGQRGCCCTRNTCIVVMLQCGDAAGRAKHGGGSLGTDGLLLVQGPELH
eukprot:scaffold89277_cov15-Tisochrysis_lutea.AAC.1